MPNSALYQIESNSVNVTTINVDLVAKVSQNAGELVNQGVIVLPITALVIL